MILWEVRERAGFLVAIVGASGYFEACWEVENKSKSHARWAVTGVDSEIDGTDVDREVPLQMDMAARQK